MYVNEQYVGAIIPAGSAVLAADDLSAAAVHGEHLVGVRVKVSKFQFIVSVVTVGAATVVLKNRVAPGVSAGEVVLATLIIPGGTAVGSVIYKNLESVDIAVGHALALEITSAATSGSGYYMFVCEQSPENPANESLMIASA